MKKNVSSQSIGAEMITIADGSPFTGSVSVLVTIDNGTQTAGGGTAPAHEGNGYHSYTPTQAETNGDHIAFTFTGTGAISTTVQVYTNFPQVGDNFARLGAPAGASVSADIAIIDGNVDDIETIVTATGVPLLATATSAQLVDDVWDEVLTGGTHNINNSSGKRLRQIDAAFEVHSGTAQAGTGTTITLDAGADATNDDIYRGDRCVIVDGTGMGEHGLAISYAASTRILTMSESWVVTPDSTSEFILVPADVDMETWNHTKVTGDGDWAGLQTTVDAIPTTAMRGTDSAATAANLATVDANVDAILVDTGTTLPAQIAALNNISVNDMLTTQMTELYAADGVAPTLAQALFLIQQTVGDFAIAGTTITTKKIDGSTTAATYTLDDGTNPTSRTRAT